MANTEREERKPAGETQPAGEAPARGEETYAGGDTWARSKVEFVLMNCIELKMRELDEVMRALRERKW